MICFVEVKRAATKHRGERAYGGMGIVVRFPGGTVIELSPDADSGLLSRVAALIG